MNHSQSPGRTAHTDADTDSEQHSFLNRCTQPSSAEISRASSLPKSPLLLFSLSPFFIPAAHIYSLHYVVVFRQGRRPEPPRRVLLQAPQGPRARADRSRHQGALFQRQERLGVAYRRHHVGHFRTWVHHRLPECVFLVFVFSTPIDVTRVRIASGIAVHLSTCDFFFPSNRTDVYRACIEHHKNHPH